MSSGERDWVGSRKGGTGSAMMKTSSACVAEADMVFAELVILWSPTRKGVSGGELTTATRAYAAGLS